VFGSSATGSHYAAGKILKNSVFSSELSCFSNFTTRRCDIPILLRMATTAPSIAHWKAYLDEPGDFDANKVWAYTSKSMSSSGSKRWSCTWCLKQFAGLSATKALSHQATVAGQDVALCLGASNGQQPKLFTEALRSIIVRKKAAKGSKNKVRICPAIYILPKTHNALLAPKTFCDLCIGNWRYCLVT
jgi:hypothetical protein